jgi:glycosyltransferase involved in cell wall biosynthesis
MTRSGVHAEVQAPVRSRTATVLDTASTSRPGALTLPLVSVVVVCYNHAAFLKACLDSVVAQTYPRLQLLVVDNASEDDSREVITSFAEMPAFGRRDLPVDIVFSSENGHEMGAILQGFARTQGSYVCFVDGDDLLLPACIETHIKAHLVSRVAVGVSSVDMYQSSGDHVVTGTGPLFSSFVVSQRGQVRDFCRMSNLDAFDFSETACEDLTADALHYVPPAMANEWVWSPSSGLCFRREAVALMLDPPPKVRAGADNYLVRGICALTGGITIDAPLAVYRLHGQNLFSKHPALANLYAFDEEQRGDLDRDVMEALIACFRANIGHLAQRLESPDLFIAAIDHFASIAPGLGRSDSSRPLTFLLENRTALIEAFGLSRYRKWVARRLRPRDLSLMLASRRHSAASDLSA